jgi:hypothetical protein
MKVTFSLFPVLITAMILVGCERREPGPIDGYSGWVNRSLQLDATTLELPEVKLDSDIKNFTIIERFVFLGMLDTVRQAVTMTFRRALKDNKFIRAERDFSGFVLEGDYWQALPYTKMRHDSTKLATQYPFMFGGVTWQNDRRAAEITYKWREMEFTLDISELVPVQFNENGGSRRTHALGTGRLSYRGVTIEGRAAYELICIDGFNAIDKLGTGVEYTNYDWTMLQTETGKTLLASTDSTSPGDRILKNFLVVADGTSLSAAEGQQYVRMKSEEIQRDRKIFEWLANRKTLEQDELGVTFDVSAKEARVFYTSGFAIAEVAGTVTIAGRAEMAWGVLEHWQQPKSDSEVLK